MATAQIRVEDRFPQVRLFDTQDYNFTHFETKHLAFDLKQTLKRAGVQPGTPAPDFELPRADGGTVRLSALRDRPVVLHFGSFT